MSTGIAFILSGLMAIAVLCIAYWLGETEDEDIRFVKCINKAGKEIGDRYARIIGQDTIKAYAKEHDMSFQAAKELLVQDALVYDVVYCDLATAGLRKPLTRKARENEVKNKILTNIATHKSKMGHCQKIPNAAIVECRQNDEKLYKEYEDAKSKGLPKLNNWCRSYGKTVVEMEKFLGLR